MGEENKKAEAVKEEKTMTAEEYREQMKENLEIRKQKRKEANEAMAQGKGVLELETPLKVGEEEVKELAYDFTELTGIEYAEAMDSDPNSMQIFRITYRQALALFARAASKLTDGLDMRDIVEKMGGSDAVEAVQLATLFFNASTRAGQMRISKKQ